MNIRNAETGRRPAKNSVGIVLCGCGPNIAGSVDLDALREQFTGLPNVEWVAKRNLSCSADETLEIIQLLKAWPVERVVVAGCSPKEREKTFQDCLLKAGMNPFMLQMANIREHCAWMETDRETATQKAATVIAAACSRVLYHEPLDTKKIDVCRDVLVIGAGVAGMEAAVLMAREGRRVHLVDRAPSVGGMVPLLGELFPAMECSSCVLEPLMDEILNHENIRLHLQTDITEVRGFCGNYRVRALERARGVDYKTCLGCGCCLEACPSREGAETGEGAVRNDYQGALPNAPLIDWRSCVRSAGDPCRACETACPFGAMDLSGTGNDLDLEVGAVVIATGAGPSQAGCDGKRVFSDYQFERMLNPGGPTAGRLILPSGSPPDSIAIVALRESPGDDRLIAGNAVKYALTVLEQLPDATVDLYKNDWALSGIPGRKKWEEIRKSTRVKIHNVHSPQDLHVDCARGAILFNNNGTENVTKPQLIVLCASQSPPEGGEALAVLLGVETDDRGFFRSDYSILETGTTSARGIFVAGSAAGPVPSIDAVGQGAAVAARVMSLLTSDARLELNPYTSIVDQDLCCACRTCVHVCPFGAAVEGESGEITVEEVLCQGCGVCSAACPSGAMRTRHFTRAQVGSEIGAICREEVET